MHSLSWHGQGMANTTDRTSLAVVDPLSLFLTADVSDVFPVILVLGLVSVALALA